MHGAVFDLTGAGAAPAAPKKATAGEDSFAVSVRNDEPIIRGLDAEKPAKVWATDLQLNIACAAVLTAVFSLLLTSAECPELIPFVLPGFAVYMIISTLGSLGKEKIQLYTAAAMGVILIALLIILRKYIGNGWGLIMNQLYDNGEYYQAYIYDRFHIGSTGDEHPYRSMHFALLWASALAGLLTALPNANIRRAISLILAALTMIAFAYYGIIPSYVCIAVFAAALLLAFSRGNILASLSVLVAVMIVFGAVVLIDPGESYGISRADEKFRDRFALRSSYLEGGDMSYDDLSGLDNMQDQQESQRDGQGPDILEQNSWVIVLLIVLAVLAAVGVPAFLYLRKLKKRQAGNRAGIDSADPREAIVAMFPYAVRWLQPAGIETAGKPFDALVPQIRADVSEEYAGRFTGMYRLWEEAAYSDHEMTADRQTEMKSFLDDTIKMIRDKSDFKTKILTAVKYAL